MLDRAKIEKIEGELSARKISITEFCRGARIFDTTWRRWRNGDFYPSFGAYTRVMDHLKALGIDVDGSAK